MARDIEYIGNVFSGQIARPAEHLLSSGVSMSVEGTMQLRRFWRDVAAGFPQLFKAISENDLPAARAIIGEDHHIGATVAALHGKDGRLFYILPISNPHLSHSTSKSANSST